MREDSEIIVTTYSVTHESRNEQITEIIRCSILVYIHLHIDKEHKRIYGTLYHIDRTCNIRSNEYYNYINVVFFEITTTIMENRHIF